MVLWVNFCDVNLYRMQKARFYVYMRRKKNRNDNPVKSVSYIGNTSNNFKQQRWHENSESSCDRMWHVQWVRTKNQWLLVALWDDKKQGCIWSCLAFFSRKKDLCYETGNSCQNYSHNHKAEIDYCSTNENIAYSPRLYDAAVLWGWSNKVWLNPG